MWPSNKPAEFIMERNCSHSSQTPLKVSDTNTGPHLPALPHHHYRCHPPPSTQYIFGRAHTLIPSLAISALIIGWILANFTHRCSFWNSNNVIHNCNYKCKVKRKSNLGGNKPSRTNRAKIVTMIFDGTCGNIVCAFIESSLDRRRWRWRYRRHKTSRAPA